MVLPGMPLRHYVVDVPDVRAHRFYQIHLCDNSVRSMYSNVIYQLAMFCDTSVNA